MCNETHEGIGKRRDFIKLSLIGAPLLSLQGAGGGWRKSGQRPSQPTNSAAHITTAAESFLSVLTPEQTAKAVMAFSDDYRTDWHFTPRARKGVAMKELDAAQRQMANVLVAAGLSREGFLKAAGIISLEPVLAVVEQGRGPVRDAELYYLTLFGKPSAEAPWGWRFEGHHISLNYTLVKGQHLASTPSFFGANPAEVLHGPRKGFRALAAEEDLARELVKSLDDKQRAQAIVSETAPSDILSSNSRKVEPIKPAGLQASKLGQKQADTLMKLLTHYAASMPAEIAAARMDRLRAAGLGNIFFAWAGGLEPRTGHYYRVQSPTFLIEYDDTQNDANHIHSVWRDFNGDFGADLLAMHYQQGHRSR
jgi:hypothetical protein